MQRVNAASLRGTDEFSERDESAMPMEPVEALRVKVMLSVPTCLPFAKKSLQTEKTCGLVAQDCACVALVVTVASSFES